MRPRTELLGVVVSLGWFGLAVSCGTGAAPAKSTPDAGDGSTSLSVAYTFKPVGCAYAVTVPSTRGFTSFAGDDATAGGDATSAAPQRVRLGLGGGITSGAAGYADPSTTAAFTWQTGVSNHSAKVRFGVAPAALSTVQAGYVWVTPPPMDGFGTNEPETYMHEVHVCGLTPATTYYYQVGGGAAGAEVWSATQSFTTVPTTGKITIGVFGDARDKVDTWALVHGRMRDAAVNLQLISGDIVDIGASEALYESWLDPIWKDPSNATKFVTLGQQMMVPIAGNHENEAARFYANFSIPGDGVYSEQFASFNVGTTHFVILDDAAIADVTTSAASVALLTWLDANLTRADADRTNHPFVVAMSHRGLFTTSLHGNDADVRQVRGVLAPLFDKHHVDLVMNGHDHEYERSMPLKAGANPSGTPVVQSSPSQGTVYIVNAGAGADPYAVGSYKASYGAKNQLFGTGTSYIGCYGIITLAANTLTLTAYGLKASGSSVSNDDVLDTLVLTH